MSKFTAYTTMLATAVTVIGGLAIIDRKTVDQLEENQQDSVMQSGVAYQVEKDQFVALLDEGRIVKAKGMAVPKDVLYDLNTLGTSNVYTLTGENSERALYFLTGQDRNGRMLVQTQAQVQASQRSAKLALAASGYARTPVPKTRAILDVGAFWHTGASAPPDPVLKAAALASGAKIYTWTLSEDPAFDAVASFLYTDGFASKEEEHADFLAAIVEDLDKVTDCGPPTFNDTYPNACITATLLSPALLDSFKSLESIEMGGSSPNSGQPSEVNPDAPPHYATVPFYSEVCPREDKDDCINSEFTNQHGAPVNKAMGAFECSFIKTALNNEMMGVLGSAHLGDWLSDPFCEDTGLDSNRGMWWSVVGPDTALANSASDEFQEFVASIAFGFYSYNSPALAFCEHNSIQDTPLVIYEMVIAPDAAGSKLSSTLRAQGKDASLTQFLTSWRARGAGKNVTLSSISFRADDDLVTLEGQDALDLIASCSESIIDP